MAQDTFTMDAAPVVPKTLAEHDKQFHPNGYQKGDKCKFREALESKDKVDAVGSQMTQKFNGSVTDDIQRLISDGGASLVSLADEAEDYQEAVKILGANDPIGASLQEKLDKTVSKLAGKIADYDELISALKNVDNPVEMPKMNPLHHDDSIFPNHVEILAENPDGSADVSIKTPWDKDATVHFAPTTLGGTGALVGDVTVNGKVHKMILKASDRQGAKYPVSGDAIMNEYIAGQTLRNAGIKAPDSVQLHDGNRTYLLSEYIENTQPLSQVQMTPQIQEQLRSAYPLLDMMFATDAFRSDNIRVDANGDVWFVDNGASFNYKGKGDKREKSNPNWQGFEFNSRNDANGKPDADGYDTSYGALYGSSKRVRGYLGKMSKVQMLKEAAKYNMSKLVSLIPDKFRSQGLVDFAKSLDKYADLFRHSSKSAPAPATTSTVAPSAQAPTQAQPSTPTTASTTATTLPTSSAPKGTAKGAFATMLQNRIASGRVPQQLKSRYGALLTPNSTSSATNQTQAQTPNPTTQSAKPNATATGAFATLLQNRIASGRVPQNIKARYGAMLTPQNATAQTPQPTNPKQATTTATGAFATMLQNRIASGRVPKNVKAGYSAMLAPQGVATTAAQQTSASTPAQVAAATPAPQQSSQTLHPNAMKMQSSIAKRLQAQLTASQPGSYTYNKALVALNTLASNGGK